jgi:hypothetical protein
VEVNSARLFTETRSIEMNILALFTDTEVNNCFSIYHAQQNGGDKKTTKIFIKTICISAPVIVVNKTAFERFR